MFEIQGNRFYLDGNPFTVYAGAIHYFRTLPEYWRDRLTKLKLAGFNTVETYICWNIHEPEKGSFDFSGRYDFEKFLSIADELGLYAIVRPSPYICAEWDFGGLPPWLLAEQYIHLRTADPRFLAHIRDYYGELLPRLVPHQIDHGGNIILMQVENEYGSFGNDKEYLRALVKMMRDGGITVPLLTSDGAEDGKLTGGTVEGALPTANFGSHTSKNLAKLGEFATDQPLMCTEFWNGWFDHWGEAHHRRPVGEVESEFDMLLREEASFSFYTFHGGTNFGFTSGANHDGRYQPTVTSYDDDALLTERGDYTPKYHAVRRMLCRHQGIFPGPLPPPLPLQNIGEIKLTESASLVRQAYRIGTVHRSKVPLTMESLGQNSGFVMYRTAIGGAYAPDEFTVDGLADRAHVFLNGDLMGILYRGDERYSLDFPNLCGGDVIEILVEAMGHVNYGPRIRDPKGITGGVRIGGQYLFDWETVSMPMDDPDLFDYEAGTAVSAPVLLRGRFTAEEGMDCFVHTEGFVKGVVWVNGFNLGRYWSIGPQKSLYLPGVLLKKDNVMVVLELDDASKGTVTITDRHHIG